MFFSDAFLDDLRARVPIVELVSEYVQLNPKGGKYWGCCPFHSEKTPSFSVDEQKGFYYCFGCHKGGNAINFLMELERMDFPEAVTELARRAGMELPAKTAEKPENKRERELIFAANTDAARYFHNLLWEPSGRRALAYLHRRGVDDKTIRRFGLGVSAEDWQGLAVHLMDKGYKEDILLAAGLIGKKNDRVYDAFRNRLMFPIINNRDQVVGFGGRVMGEGEPKYLNTSDTPVFNKRMGVYALNIAKRARGLSTLYLVEGYMDVIALHQKGVPGAVATLGTALTKDQCRLLARFASRITVCYDGDSAGRKAALRALELLDDFDIEVRVIALPADMDPDEYIGKYGREDFLALPGLSAAQYRMLRFKDEKDMSLLEDRTKYAIESAEVLRRVENPVERENYVKQLMLDTGFSREVLLDQIKINAGRENRPKRRIIQNEKKEADFEKAEKLVLCALTMDIPPDTVRETDFVTDDARDIARMLISGRKPDAILAEIAEENRRNALAGVFAMEIKHGDSAQLTQIVLQSVATMRAANLTREIEILRERIAQTDEEEKTALLKKLMNLVEEEGRLGSMKGRVVTLEQ